MELYENGSQDANPKRRNCTSQVAFETRFQKVTLGNDRDLENTPRFHTQMKTRFLRMNTLPVAPFVLSNAVQSTRNTPPSFRSVFDLPRFISLIVMSLLLSAAPLSAEVSTSELPVLTGTEVVSIDSKSVGDDFILYVRVPPAATANPDQTFPVIYALDGDHTFPMMCSITTELSWSGAVPPVIVVGIGYGTLDLENGNHRSRDLSPQPYPGSPDSGGGSKFLEFLLTEAVPHIEASYPADPEQRYLFGHSLGGLFALYTYSKNADTFQGIVAGSPFLAGQLDLLNETAGDAAPRSCRLFIATGDEEDAKLFIDDLAPLKAKLDNSWAVPGSYETVLLPGFDHFTSVAPSISKGLKSVFARPATTSH